MMSRWSPLAGKRQYIRLSDRTSLYSPEREYDMGYFRVTTTRYEKYLGMKNGVEYGWGSLTYPGDLRPCG